MHKPSLPVAIVFLLASISFAQPHQLPPGAEDASKALSASPRHGEWIDIAIPKTESKLHTFIVYPERKENAPVVLVIHEIFGMTDWVRAVADQLAAEGFIAVAPDLLSAKGPDGGNTDSFKGDDVRAAIQKLTPDEVTVRLNTARQFAIRLPSATRKVGTIGFCWGGGQSFAYATRQPSLNAAVVYYGSPPAEDALSKIKCPVLGLYAGDDARITKTVEPTAKAMNDLGKSYTTHVYDGAGHGFLRQQSARDANRKAAEQAWPQTIEFLKKNLE